MFEPEYSLDAHALEILILAFGFLSLICFFAIVVLTGANLRRASDAERGERITAWGGRWWPEDEREQAQEPYSDDTFIDSVRRHSASWATEIKEELSCLTERLVPKRMSDDPSPLDLVAGPLRRMSEQAQEQSRRSMLGVNCEQDACDVEDSSVVASGRTDGQSDTRRRSTKAEVKDSGDVCDLISKECSN